MKARHILVLGWVLLLVRGVLGAEFEFVVIGDTRPRFESESFRAFETLIPRINALHPALVLNVGDLIYGYGPRNKAKQWDAYERAVKGFRVPYYQLPGNHDTYSRKARRVYGQRFGRFYQSVDYADCHFVLLDNTEAGRWGYLGPEQLEWLQHDLQATRARSVFVFLHFPTWEPERLAPRHHDFWQQTLHPLFKQSRVRAVFGGHFHAYGPTREIDGIQYFITGGGGAELVPEYRKAGGDHHFLRVKVSGEAFQVRVVTGSGELSDPEADIMGGFVFADKYSSRVGIDRGTGDLRSGVPFSITVQNPYAEHLIGEAKWALDASAFLVEPGRIQVRIPPGGTQQNTFVFKALRGTVPLGAAPRLEFDVNARSRRHRFYREILFLEQRTAAFRQQPPILDAQFGDWTPMAAPSPSEVGKAAYMLRACHTRDTLFLAVRVPAVPAEAKEEFGWSDDLQLGVAHRRNETDFGGDFLRLGCAVGRPGALNRSAGSKAGQAVAGVHGVCRAAGEQTVLELAIPLRLLRGGQGQRNEPLIVNLSFAVAEPPAEAPEPTEPPVNSTAYQVRYGSRSLAPIHFVELTLERQQ